MIEYHIADGARNIYFIGIGGSHMSGMARLLSRAGFRVSGSDAQSSAATDALKRDGITAHIGHDARNLTADIDIIVYSAAVRDDNVELSAARGMGLRIMERAEMLGLIMKNYSAPICVSGSHGKTTTTGMLGGIYKNSGGTAIVGGVVPSMGGAVMIGSDGGVFVAESCEYRDSFLRFFPYVGVILNIELDHTDYFADLASIRRSFRAFAELIPSDGALIINANVDNIGEITDGLTCRVITFNGDWAAEDVAQNGGGTAFTAVHDGLRVPVSLNVPGRHNVDNALAALAACAFVNEAGRSDVTAAEAAEKLSLFSGANRRFQLKGTLSSGAVVFDDYAHHPTEIAATIATAAKRGGKVFCIFQPHTRSRTSELLDGFAAALRMADKAVVLDIYEPSGREEDIDIHSRDLVALIQGGVYADSFGAAADVVRREAKRGDTVVVMGAGSVTDLCKILLYN